MREGSPLDLDPAERAALWARASAVIEERTRALTGDAAGTLPLAPARRAFAEELAGLDLATARTPREVLEEALAALATGAVHTDHPRYFGLFNVAPAALAVLGDALAAAFDPQLATRSHAPWPVAVEERLIGELGVRFGWPRAEVAGTFTSGGAEANTTALACALVATFPEYVTGGARALAAPPRLYVSTEGHATVTRAARLAGLGDDAVRVVSADGAQRLKPNALREALGEDRQRGLRPFLLVATAGTTGAGGIDPLGALAEIAQRERLWLHVDAAWGGLAALVPELRPALAGIERADSITFDPHKAMSAPLGTGTLLLRHAGVLERTFTVGTGYMPRDAAADPWARGPAWSRRFLGLRVFLPLAALGWDGYAASVRRQVALAGRLREGLVARGWRVVSDTPLPIVCFVDGEGAGRRRDRAFLEAVARAVLARNAGWISVPRFASGARALRACITSHRTEASDVDGLVDALDAARADARAAGL